MLTYSELDILANLSIPIFSWSSLELFELRNLQKRCDCVYATYPLVDIPWVCQGPCATLDPAHSDTWFGLGVYNLIQLISMLI